MGTQGRWPRFAAAITAGLLVGMLLAPAAVSAQDGEERSAQDVEMGEENWFYRFRNLPREAPGDLQGGPAGPALGTARGETDLYARVPPGGSTGETLHVGVVAGQPEARTFLALPTMELLTEDDGFGEVLITGGEITLTDAGTEHGSRGLATADIIACAGTEAVFGGRGGDWADMPGFDCATHAPVEPVEGSDPLQFTIDLEPLAPAFADNPDAQVVALVEGLVREAGAEDPRAAEPQSWHLAVHSNLTCFEGDRAPGEDDLEVDGQNCVDGRPITADLTYRVDTLDVDFDFGDEDLGDFEDAGDFGDAAFEEGFDDDFAGDMPVDEGAFEEGFDEGFGEEGAAFSDDAVAGEEVADGGDLAEPAPEGAAQPQAAGPAAEERGVRTPRSLFLLPLLGVGLAGMLGYSLTRPPELPAAREGAVSALMRRRRLKDGSPPA